MQVCDQMAIRGDPERYYAIVTCRQNGPTGFAGGSPLWIMTLYSGSVANDPCACFLAKTGATSFAQERARLARVSSPGWYTATRSGGFPRCSVGTPGPHLESTTTKWTLSTAEPLPAELDRHNTHPFEHLDAACPPRFSRVDLI